MSKETMRIKNDMTSFEGDDGSFEILIDDEAQESMARSSGAGRSASKGGSKTKVILSIGALAVLVIGGLSFAALSAGGIDEEGSPLVFDESPGFQPYRGDGTEAAAPEPVIPQKEAPAAPVQRAERRAPVEDEDEGYDRARDWRIGEHDVIGLEPDGKRIVSDSRGVPMSRREAQMRAERELNAIKNSPTEFERRLHRRDAVLNSRVLVPHVQGAKIAPGVQISKDIQRDLIKAVPGRVREGRSDENFVDDESGYYVDLEGEFEEGFDDDLYDDELYDEEDWDELHR